MIGPQFPSDSAPSLGEASADSAAGSADDADAIPEKANSVPNSNTPGSGRTNARGNMGAKNSNAARSCIRGRPTTMIHSKRVEISDRGLEPTNAVLNVRTRPLRLIGSGPPV